MMNASFEFHPVGQGLFYTGSIYDEGTPFSFAYDCGGEKRFIGREIESYYRRHGSKALDLIVLSHLHADHINGVKKLLGLTTDPNDSKRTRVVMPYSNKAMNLLYEFEYILSKGYDKEASQFYNNPIRAIRSFRECEIILVTSDIEKAVGDAKDDGLDFRLENELKGVKGAIYKLNEGSGSEDNSNEYSNVYLVEGLSGALSSNCWFYEISQPSFDFSKYELFKQLCKKYDFSEAMDIFRNKAALSEIRRAKLCLNDSCIVMKHWFNDTVNSRITILTGDLSGKEANCFLKEIVSREGQRPFVFQIPHHGAKCKKGSCIVDAEFSVVSYGCYNTYGHPDSETIKRYLEKSTIVSVNENKLFAYGVRPCNPLRKQGLYCNPYYVTYDSRVLDFFERGSIPDENDSQR